MNETTIQDCKTNGYSLIRKFLNGAELARLRSDLRQLASAFYGKLGVEAMNATDSELAAGWLVAGVLHGLPCGRSTHRKPTSSSTRYSKLTKPVGQQ